ncbi:MAG: hypothetical protein LUD39_04405 [Opitutae bacterium]|nr:hypothetical protein [Opitutae bacterium]
MKRISILLALASLLFASGCTTDQGNFTVLSNKIVNLRGFNLSTSQKVKHTTGKQENFTIVVIPFGDMNPNLGGALNDCFKNNDADLLTDAHVYQSSFWFPLIYSKHGFYVEGDAVKTRRN